MATIVLLSSPASTPPMTLRSSRMLNSPVQEPTSSSLPSPSQLWGGPTRKRQKIDPVTPSLPKGQKPIFRVPLQDPQTPAEDLAIVHSIESEPAAKIPPSASETSAPKAPDTKTPGKSAKAKTKSASRQSKLKKARVSKPGLQSKGDKSAKDMHLQLQEAVRRRTSWTPVKESTPGSVPRPKVDFGGLLAAYGLEKNPVAPQTLHQSFQKSRRIDLVVGHALPSPAPAKKKRPVTITERAVAPYVPDEVVITGKKTTIILSPETAVKQVRRQEFVFGTSSQLVSDDTPAEIRQLRQAQRLSWDNIEECGDRAEGLWGAAAHEGEQYGVRSLHGDTYCAASSNSGSNGPVPDSLPVLDEALEGLTSDTVPVSDEVSGPGANVRIPGNLAVPVDNIRRLVVEENNLIPHANDNRDGLEKPKDVDTSNTRHQTSMATENMPNYQGFTNDQLAKTVAAYQFKKVRSRAAMIDLLEKCWRSKRQRPMQSSTRAFHQDATKQGALNSEVNRSLKRQAPLQDNNQSPPKDPTLSPKRQGRPPKKQMPVPENNQSPLKDPTLSLKRRGRPPKKQMPVPENNQSPLKDPTLSPKRRGRPPKDRSQAAPNLDSSLGPKATIIPAQCPSADDSTRARACSDEIYDSDPATPSPPRAKQVRPLILSAESGPSKFDAMTTAVITCPPSHDSSNPTWWERILAYEPIVIEDLTLWLNTKGLAMVQEDDEVSIDEVKAWCEWHSVCCLWRENLRGGTRARY